MSFAQLSCFTQISIICLLFHVNFHLIKATGLLNLTNVFIQN